mmetsp:Transcript_36188/g.81318  ORF Transcript_36188/g.81318 Transcript_36188/m.81318 type:complete len:116 (-) Transcript_36188:215-562(-)
MPEPEPMPEPMPEPEDATPEAPVFAASKSMKSNKAHKAHKAKSVKSWKSKGGKTDADYRSEMDGMLAWWEGNVAFNKDGSSQSDIAMNLENGSSRSRSLRIGAVVAFIFGALACL